MPELLLFRLPYKITSVGKSVATPCVPLKLHKYVNEFIEERFGFTRCVISHLFILHH